MSGNELQVELEKRQLAAVLKLNEKSERFGLTLTEEDARLIVAEKNDSLKEERRIEFGQSIIPLIIEKFCDSDYISQDNYVESIVRIQNIFFRFKNESEDLMTDEELLNFMKEQFETTCYGDFDYLEGTVLEIFCEVVRAGYKGYQGTDGEGVFGEFDIVTRWDRDLFNEMMWKLTT